MSSVFYRMGDLKIGVEADDLAILFKGPVRSFETDCSRPDISFRFHPLNPLSLDPTQVEREEIAQLAHRFRCFNGNWNSPFLAALELRRLLDDPCLSADSVSLELLDSSLRLLDFGRCTQDIFHLPEMASGTLFAFRGEFFLAPFLAAFNAVILHSSCVVRGGRAAVFLGHDGAGKTTVAASAPWGDILCDDQVILRRDGSRHMAYGTLWGRTFQAGGHAPVGALFFLEQSDHFALTEISPLVAMKYLWTEYPYYHFPLPLKLCSQAFDVMLGLSRQIPAYLMRFGRGDICWESIDRVIQASG